MTFQTPARVENPLRRVRADGRHALHVGARLYSVSARHHRDALRSVCGGKFGAEPISLVQSHLKVVVHPSCQAPEDINRDLTDLSESASSVCLRHGHNHDSEGVGRVRNQNPQLRFPV